MWRNWHAYAAQHGYTVLAGDTSASKQSAADKAGKVAALSHLLMGYDWVLYLSPDTWFTRVDQPLDMLLPADEEASMLVAASALSAQQGVRALLLRNSEWTHSFLQAWLRAARKTDDKVSSPQRMAACALSNVARPACHYMHFINQSATSLDELCLHLTSKCLAVEPQLGRNVACRRRQARSLAQACRQQWAP